MKGQSTMNQARPRQDKPKQGNGRTTVFQFSKAGKNSRCLNYTDFPDRPTYTMKVLAFTSVGDGPASSVTTLEGGKYDWICCLGKLTKKYCSFERAKFKGKV